MKQRTNNNNRRGKSKWEPDYPTVGSMDFNVQGYVQKIAEGNNVDYVTFLINNPYVKGNVNSINVEVPWDDCPQLELGDHVAIYGNIRSWWNADIERVTYSFVAEQVGDIEDEPEPEPEKPKGRRGIAKPLGDD